MTSSNELQMTKLLNENSKKKAVSVIGNIFCCYIFKTFHKHIQSNFLANTVSLFLRASQHTSEQMQAGVIAIYFCTNDRIWHLR